MRIACIYTVERGARRDKPLEFSMDISFGIGIVATLLKSAGHDVDLLVFARQSLFKDRLRNYINNHRPRLFCLTAVSTQFPFISEIARLIKNTDPTIFIIIGGHHASLHPDSTIKLPFFDAICVGEGEDSILDLTKRFKNGSPITGIPNLWIKKPGGVVEKNPTLPFKQNLDSLPYIDRKMWEPWINEPQRYPSLLLGRGCFFRCAYCSNHAMRRLSSGSYVRFRSPENIIGEIEHICNLYPDINNIYLEVETIDPQKNTFVLFEKLEEFNKLSQKELSFGLNFTFTSAYIRKEKQCRELFELFKRANVSYINVGLESGSERVRRDVLRRPTYTNEDFFRFSKMAKEHDIDFNVYVLFGVPGETLEDYRKTLQLVRKIQPKLVFHSIYYPYPGTDLFNIALEQGLIQRDFFDTKTERTRAVMDLPGFSRRRVRLEYVLFWFKVYRGHWPMSKLLVYTVKSIFNGSPVLWSTYNFFQERSNTYKLLRNVYRSFLDRSERK